MMLTVRRALVTPLLLTFAVACSNSAPPASTDGGDGGGIVDTLSPDTTPPPDEISFETVDKGAGARLQQPFNEVIDNDADWQAFWTKLDNGARPAPSVDFNTHVVIGVGLGNRFSGGFAATVVAIGQPAGEQHLLVSYTETTPGAGCATTAAVTQPYHIVKVTKQSLPFRFKVSVKPDKPCAELPPLDACGKLSASISASLAKLNTCVEDSDCLLQGGDCPFGCYIPTHKDVQRSEIDALLKPWQDSSCRKCAYGCAAADKVACIGGRCEVIQPDLI